MGEHNKSYRAIQRAAEKQKLEEHLRFGMRVRGLPSPIPQYRFCPTRRWLSDFAFPERKILIEVEGGIWGRVVTCDRCWDAPGIPHRVMRKLKNGRRIPIREGSGHNTGKAMNDDMEKYNEAAIMGYTVLRFSDKQIFDETAFTTIERALEQFPTVSTPV